MESSRSDSRNAWWRFHPRNCASRSHSSSTRILRDLELADPARDRTDEPHMLVTKAAKGPSMLQQSRFVSRKRPCFRLLYCSCECANYTSSVILFGRAVEELMKSNFNRAAFNRISFL